jgi:hypothetical protein
MSVHLPHERPLDDKSIQVTDNLKTALRQKAKDENRVRMSNTKEPCNRGNTTPKLFRLMQECKSIEEMSNPKMRDRQDP